MAEVRIEGVSKTYDNGVVAVRDVTLTVQDREFVVLVGPSGCGKSTLLRMVAGLEDITEGAISIDGQRVNEMPPRKRDVAMVFQNYALYPHMNVFENMALSLRIRKERRDVLESRVREAATMLGIDGLLDRRPSQLSGGQRQRVALGRAIVRRPKVFLFDEPLSNLDAKMRVETRTEISRLHRELQATMIYVTHDQTEAMTMGSRIVVLKDGEVQQIASPLELYDRPANRFVASFLGSPPMNFWPARLASDGEHLRMANQDLTLHGAVPQTLRGLAQQDLVIGLRPEDLRLAAEASGLSATLRVTVDVVEPLGSETLLYFGANGNRGVARVAPTEAVEVGSDVDLRANLARAHFFDPQTGQTVLSRPGL